MENGKARFFTFRCYPDHFQLQHICTWKQLNSRWMTNPPETLVNPGSEFDKRILEFDLNYTSIISTSELVKHLGDPHWVMLDCRFSLEDTERGRRDYLHSHIPGAVYAHLDEDLSGTVTPGLTGRHPLPAIDTFVDTLSEWGVGRGVQVVAYDDMGGVMGARLWWMLHWLGHTSVAVLDGGWPRWQDEEYPVQNVVQSQPRNAFVPHLRSETLTSTNEVEAMRLDPTYLIIDSRAAERYRGENETIDPVAGHIPGAISAPYEDNLGPDGTFLPPEELRARFHRLLGDIPVENAVFYCGSGVSAAHNLVALAHAGLGHARLYAGSWSEWITDPQRPVG